MTLDTNQIASARKHFLAALNDPQLDTALLRNMMQELKDSQSSLVVEYLADENLDVIQASALHWDESYFTLHKKLAERNFSIERLEHLIQVRERFRKEGRKGFVTTTKAMSPAARQEIGTDFIPSNNLKKFVDEGDLMTVRTALTLDLEDIRLDSRTLRCALAWAKSRLPDLCEPYNEKAFARGIEKDRQQWTGDYYNKQLVYLDTSFTEERFLHLIEIREEQRRHTAKKPETASKPTRVEPSPSPPPSRPTPAHNRHSLSPVMRAALLIGGALAAVVILILALRK